MAYVELHNSKRKEAWLLDSGYNNHMSGNKQWFLNLDETFRQVVKLGNNSKMTVMRKGSIRLQVNGTVQVIGEVFYIPELKNNLLSIGQLQEDNLAILVQHGECKIYHPIKGLIMQTTMSTNRMFIILASVQTQASTPACFQTTSEDKTYLWH